MEGYEMGPYSYGSQESDGTFTPRYPLLQKSNDELFIQSDGLAPKHLKEPVVTLDDLSHEERPKEDFQHLSYATALQRGWLLEILAFILALLAMTAIVITLALHNGNPLPNWPFQISVNALISVFAVILKGTMMIPITEAISQLKFVWYRDPKPLIHLTQFDLASRGPWGAVRLIRALHGRHLASLGAAITILAIASDPFIQQVIKYHPCPQTVGSLQASILRTNNYTIDGIHDGADQSTLDPPMQAALYEGVYDSFSTVVPNCPTGNCTFPHYRTVGMCSGCKDISDTINTACGAVLPHDEFQPCNWTLPSGLKLNMSEGVVMRMATVTDTTALVVSEIITFTELLDYDQKHLMNITDEQPSDVMALQCALFPCVRTYDTEVVQSQNTEVLLDTFEMVQVEMTGDTIELAQPNAVRPLAPYIGTPMPCLLDGIYYDPTSFTQRNGTNKWPVTGLLPNNATAYLPSDCVFMYANTLGLQGYLPTFLQGFVAEAPEVSYANPAWMGQLYNKGNASLSTINATWAAVADSMTVRVRRSGDPSNSAPAAGVVLLTDTCISVQWPWLLFPAALLVLTLAFLLATMAQSARYTNRHIWKGSPLALLFHGLDQELSNRHRRVDQLDEMEARASNTVVQIKYTEGGLRFVDAARR